MKGFALSLAALAAACLTPAEPKGVHIQTAADFASAIPNEQVSIRYAVSNMSDHAVLISRCGSHVNPAVDRWENGAWVNYASAMCIAVLPSVPLSLSPGATYEDSTFVAAGGVFQLRLGTSDAPSQATTRSIASNRFRVR